MKTLIMCALIGIASSLQFSLSHSAMADSIVLANGDILQGKVVLLDEKSLRLASENFGDLTVARDKIEAIYLGDAKPPVLRAEPLPGQAAALQQLNPLLQDPRTQAEIGSLMGQLFGGQNGLGEARRNAAAARDSLQDLKKDMTGPEREAIDAYINLFDLIAPPNTSPTDTSPTDE